MRTSAFIRAKTSDFSKFVVCPHGKRRLSQYGHFVDKEMELFCDFVRMSFMDGPLIKK